MIYSDAGFVEIGCAIPRLRAPYSVIRWFVFLGAFLCFSNCVAAGQDPLDQLPGLRLERLYGDQGRSYALGALAIGESGGDLFLSGTYDDAMDAEGGKKLWLWRIGRNGENQARYEDTLEELSSYVAIESMAISEEGHILASLRKQDRSTHLLVIDTSKSTIISAMPLENGFHVSKILTSVGHYFLLGQKNLDAMIIKFSYEGDELWKIVSDRGQDEVFVDGLIRSDGSLLLVENSGKLEQFFIAESDIWLLHVSANGKSRLLEKSFPGRGGSLEFSSGGSLVICYDISNDYTQNIHLKGIDENLDEVWTTAVTKVTLGFEKFTAVPARDQVLVIGQKSNRSYVTSFSFEGTRNWEYLGLSKPPAVGVKGTCVDEICKMAAAQMAIGKADEPENKVRLDSFSLPSL